MCRARGIIEGKILGRFGGRKSTGIKDFHREVI